MTSEVEWSQMMSDKDFVAASEKYFKRNRIDLHIACCLLAKVNPETKEPPVGEGFREWDMEPETELEDYTRRPFLVALRALNGEDPTNPLVPAEPIPSDLNNARDIIVSTRTFVAWATHKWNRLKYIRLAEERYQEKKAASPTSFLSNPKTTAQMREEQQRGAFEKLMADLGSSGKAMSTHELSHRLEKVVRDTDYSAAWETLRKRISKWKSGLG